MLHFRYYISMKLKDLPQHHAVLVEASVRDALASSFFQELQALSPVHTFFNHKILDISGARAIISWAQTPYNDEKIGLISFNTIGLEAQNALLKILEEPRHGVRLVLITSNTANIIDTVLSRVHVVKENKSAEDLHEAEKFLATSYESRISLPYVVELLSRSEKINGKERKDKEGIRLFILALTTVLEQKHVDAKYIQETLEIASYVADPSSSGKALMEYLALLLPVAK